MFERHSAKLKAFQLRLPIIDYFKRVAHAKCTRANNMNVALPKIRTESGKKNLCIPRGNSF